MSRRVLKGIFLILVILVPGVRPAWAGIWQYHEKAEGAGKMAYVYAASGKSTFACICDKPAKGPGQLRLMYVMDRNFNPVLKTRVSLALDSRTRQPRIWGTAGGKEAWLSGPEHQGEILELINSLRYKKELGVSYSGRKKGPDRFPLTSSADLFKKLLLFCGRNVDDRPKKERAVPIIAQKKKKEPPRSGPTKTGSTNFSPDQLAARINRLNQKAARGDLGAMKALHSLPAVPLPDVVTPAEQRVMDALKRADTPKNRENLAWVRRDLALRHLKRYDHLGLPQDLDLAILHAQSAVELAPQRYEFWVVQGMVLLRHKGDPTSRYLAQKAFERVIGGFPNLLPILAKLQLMNGEYRSAALSYERLLTVRPKGLSKVDPHDMNIAFIKSRLLEFGLQAYDDYLADFPDKGAYRLSKAILLRATGDKAGARTELNKVLKNPSQPPEIRRTAVSLRQHWRKHD